MGHCLRMMRDKVYENWDEELPSIQHAKNTTYSEAIGCTPHELHHGRKARKLGQNAFLGTKSPPDAATALANAQRHVQLYTSLARAHDAYMRKLNARKLNEGTATRKRKRGSQKFKIGQKVIFYVAPGQNQAKARNRRVKHMLRFRGPATITKRLSDTTFELRVNKTRRMFHVVNVWLCVVCVVALRSRRGMHVH